MLDIVIGAPVFERAWAIEEWFKCLENQEGFVSKDLELVFAITDGKDNTREIIENHRAKFKDIVLIDCNDVAAFGDRDNTRFFSLVILRNRIIEYLRERQPTHYFSWDTDILIPNNTLKQLIEDDKDIVAPYVDLVPPSMVPNCATKGKGESFVRRKPYSESYPLGEFYKVDTCFAIFLMKNIVFNTCLYGWNSGGEDYGWGNEVIKAGFESWMDSRIIGTHFYNKGVLK
jgi:glycosyltransferase involved in cell wall biosynthesis